MKFMGRAARMERHHKRHKGGAAINLVSMMDIFTILVFFLLVNSSEVEVLPNAKDIVLPDSTAEEKARESVVVLLTDTQVLVQGQARRPSSRPSTRRDALDHPGAQGRARRAGRPRDVAARTRKTTSPTAK